MGNPPFGTDAVFLSFCRWLPGLVVGRASYGGVYCGGGASISATGKVLTWSVVHGAARVAAVRRAVGIRKLENCANHRCRFLQAPDSLAIVALKSRRGVVT